jgi:hypothetical protein
VTPDRGGATGRRCDVRASAPPVVPFAVRPTPEARSDLWRLDRPVPTHVDDEGPPTLVRVDAEVPTLVAAKRTAVAVDPAPWTAVALDLDDDAASAAGWRLAAAVAAEHPDLVALDGTGLVLPGVGVRLAPDGGVEVVRRDRGAAVAGDAEAVARRLDEVPPAHRPLEAVALAVAEDAVLVDGNARAAWLHVCAPSGWDPGASAGAPLASLHAPIPHADRLLAASASLARAIVGSGPHVRWVWGLSDDPSAAQHPRFRPPPREVGEVASLTFRAERQTTLPLPDLDLGVFLIRVHRSALGEVASTPDRRARLAATIRSLPPALAAYKGVADRREELLRWLDDG